MPPKVFFADVQEKIGMKWDNVIASICENILPNSIKPGGLIAIKLHMGERGGGTFIRPSLVRPIVEFVKELGGRPFLTDTSTLYRRGRGNALEYLETALTNGFSPGAVGCPIIIGDGLKGEAGVELNFNGKRLKKVYVASAIASADGMVVVSHGKGHRLCGFGGAIKNVGMGCLSMEGKISIHRASQPVVKEEACVGCGVCQERCRWGAIELTNGKARIDYEACVGCFDCFIACPSGAVGPPEKGREELLARLAEAAAAVAAHFEGRISYVNFLIDITELCDCVPNLSKKLAPDVGVLGSNDMVAIDKASMDLILQRSGNNRAFLETYGVDPEIAIREAEKLGLGDPTYELVKV